MKKKITLFAGALALTLGVSAANSNTFAASATGWKAVSGHCYYYTAKGKTTGWLKDGGKWYYLDGSGVMKTGWVHVGGKWYYLNASGAMQTGWVHASGKWYFLDAGGAMKTGWVKNGGAWYFLDASGAMKTGWLKQGTTTYYLLPSGAMATGWQTIAGKQYYFAASGAMAVNTTINGKKIGSDGAVVTALTPLSKAIADAAATGATVKAQSDGSYNIYMKDINVGDFYLDPEYSYIEGLTQFTSLFAMMALDLGFNANAKELESLANQVQTLNVSNYNVYEFNNGKDVSFDWTPKVPSPTASVTKTVNDIKAAGAVAKPGADGSYNIFKNNVYIGYFLPDPDFPAVEGNGQYSALLQTVALDLGYGSSAADLSNLVNQVMNNNATNDNVVYDRASLTLSIEWETPAAAAAN